MGTILGRRALNRALLARQLLLRRARLPAADAIEHLVGMQGQAPNAPYYGLWTRLAGFRHEELSTLISERLAVRITLMRGTLHLVTVRDALRLRPSTQQVLERGVQRIRGLAGLDLDEVVKAGRALLEERPRTFAELGPLLQELWPDRDAVALARVVRWVVPLVQVPPRGLWRTKAPAAHTTVESWLGLELAGDPAPDEALLRYLGAFGPATVQDMRAWSGVAGLREVVDRLRPRLRTFADERGNELFDLPDAPLPDQDTPAPVRFLPDFDNLVLSHADRTRVVAEERRGRIMANGVGRPSFLVDGFVAGTWKLEKGRLLVRPFVPLAAAHRAALAEEGGRLLAFAAAEAADHDVRFLPPE
jgi:hypothetical protein